MADTSLESVPSWTKDQVARMKESWITTAEQVVAVSVTRNGLRSLAEQLKISEGEARRLVEAAKTKLTPATRKEMEERVNTSDYGLGVLPQKKDESM